MLASPFSCSDDDDDDDDAAAATTDLLIQAFHMTNFFMRSMPSLLIAPGVEDAEPLEEPPASLLLSTARSWAFSTLGGTGGGWRSGNGAARWEDGEVVGKSWCVSSSTVSSSCSSLEEAFLSSGDSVGGEEEEEAESPALLPLVPSSPVLFADDEVASAEEDEDGELEEEEE